MCLKSKDTQIVHELMAKWGAKIMPDNWVCKYSRYCWTLFSVPKLISLWIIIETHKNVASNWRLKLINDHDFNLTFGPRPLTPGGINRPCIFSILRLAQDLSKTVNKYTTMLLRRVCGCVCMCVCVIGCFSSFSVYGSVSCQIKLSKMLDTSKQAYLDSSLMLMKGMTKNSLEPEIAIIIIIQSNSRLHVHVTNKRHSFTDSFTDWKAGQWLSCTCFSR